MALTSKYSFYNYISLALLFCIHIFIFCSPFHKLLLIIGCDAKHLFDLIQGSWGEQPDVESPPQDEDEAVFKKFRASSPTPLTTSISLTISSSTPRQPPTMYFIPPWEVGALASIPARQQTTYELCDTGTKKYYFPTCGNATGNHDSLLTHVCQIHLNIVLGCHYCDFVTPSFSTLKKHVSDKHVGLGCTSCTCFQGI